MKAFKANINTILVTVISSVVLIIITGVIGFVKMQRINTITIESIKVSKVDQEKFNSFLSTFAEHAALTHERIAIIAKDLDELDKRQREIELTKLRNIENKLTQLESKIRITLGKYETFEVDTSIIENRTALKIINQCIKPKSYDLQRTIKGLNQ